MGSSANEPAQDQIEMHNSEERNVSWCLLWAGWGWTHLGHPVVSGSRAEPLNSHTQLCTGYFQLLCSYVKEERLFPLCMYLYFAPDISKFWLPWSKIFCKERPNIFFFPLVFMKTYEDILVCAAPPMNWKCCGRQSLVRKPRWDTKKIFVMTHTRATSFFLDFSF